MKFRQRLSSDQILIRDESRASLPDSAIAKPPPPAPQERPFFAFLAYSEPEDHSRAGDDRHADPSDANNGLGSTNEAPSASDTCVNFEGDAVLREDEAHVADEWATIVQSEPFSTLPRRLPLSSPSTKSGPSPLFVFAPETPHSRSIRHHSADRLMRPAALGARSKASSSSRSPPPARMEISNTYAWGSATTQSLFSLG
ncbi:unnamed protein product, partial [Amoebophrya sp. A25]|eukprot:GSA25T00001172001.1